MRRSRRERQLRLLVLSCGIKVREDAEYRRASLAWLLPLDIEIAKVILFRGYCIVSLRSFGYPNKTWRNCSWIDVGRWWWLKWWSLWWRKGSSRYLILWYLWKGSEGHLQCRAAVYQGSVGRGCLSCTPMPKYISHAVISPPLTPGRHIDEKISDFWNRWYF